MTFYMVKNTNERIFTIESREYKNLNEAILDLENEEDVIDFSESKKDILNKLSLLNKCICSQIL